MNMIAILMPVMKKKSEGSCLIKNYINQNIIEADTINCFKCLLIDHFASVHHNKKCHSEGSVAIKCL